MRRGVRSSADHIIRRLSAPPVATNLPEEETATASITAMWCIVDAAFDFPLLPFLEISLMGRRAGGAGTLVGALRGAGRGGSASFHLVRNRSLETV